MSLAGVTRRTLLASSLLCCFAIGKFPKCESLTLSTDELQELAILKSRTNTPFTEVELEAGFRALGRTPDRTGPCEDKPKAFWVLGPSASGKSTVTNMLQTLPWFPTASGYQKISLDGDTLRMHHGAYQKLVAWGLKRNCVVKEAWPLVKGHLKKAKAKLLEVATDSKCRRNLEVPETCTALKRCQKDMQRLKAIGYTIHVVAVYGPRDAIIARGTARADKSGKAYSEKKFPDALAAFVPVMAMGNGVCMLVNNTELPPKVSIQQSCAKQEKYSSADAPSYLHDVESEALKGTGVTFEEYTAAQIRVGILTKTSI